MPYSTDNEDKRMPVCILAGVFGYAHAHLINQLLQLGCGQQWVYQAAPALAYEVGSKRSTVSRNLKQLSAAGLLSIRPVNDLCDNNMEYRIDLSKLIKALGDASYVLKNFGIAEGL